MKLIDSLFIFDVRNRPYAAAKMFSRESAQKQVQICIPYLKNVLLYMFYLVY